MGAKSPIGDDFSVCDDSADVIGGRRRSWCSGTKRPGTFEIQERLSRRRRAGSCLTEQDGISEIEESLSAQILKRTLEALVEDSAFDDACIERLQKLAAEGKMSRADRVIAALEVDQG